MKLSFPLNILIMKYSHFICFSLLATLLYFFSTSLDSLSPSYLQGRRSLTNFRLSSSNEKFETPKIKETAEEKMQSTTTQEGQVTVAVKYRSSDENLDEQESVVYHIDYHGVTTHPSPTPKHPKPYN